MGGIYLQVVCYHLHIQHVKTDQYEQISTDNFILINQSKLWMLGSG